MQPRKSTPYRRSTSRALSCRKISLQGFFAIEIRIATDGEALANMAKISLAGCVLL
jgi:hypothetical protein